MLAAVIIVIERDMHMSWAKEFKAWIMKGNLVEIAVGLILALAFAEVVKSFTENIITPIIAAIGGQPDFSGLNFKINGSIFKYGLFINAVIAFLITGFILFLVVKATLKLFKEKPAVPTEYRVEKADSTILNQLSEDGWEVVTANEDGVILKK